MKVDVQNLFILFSAYHVFSFARHCRAAVETSLWIIRVGNVERQFPTQHCRDAEPRASQWHGHCRRIFVVSVRSRSAGDMSRRERHLAPATVFVRVRDPLCHTVTLLSRNAPCGFGVAECLSPRYVADL